MGVLWGGSIASRGCGDRQDTTLLPAQSPCVLGAKAGARRKVGTRQRLACPGLPAAAGLQPMAGAGPALRAAPARPAQGWPWVGDPHAGGVPPALRVGKASCSENPDHCCPELTAVLGHPNTGTHQSGSGSTQLQKLPTNSAFAAPARSFSCQLLSTWQLFLYYLFLLFPQPSPHPSSLLDGQTLTPQTNLPFTERGKKYTHKPFFSLLFLPCLSFPSIECGAGTEPFWQQPAFTC